MSAQIHGGENVPKSLFVGAGTHNYLKSKRNM